MRITRNALGALLLVVTAIVGATAPRPSAAAVGQVRSAPGLHNQPSQHHRPAMRDLRHSMQKYRDPAVAVAAGWIPTDDCVELPDRSGGMGYHYLNPRLLGEAPDLRHPAILVYVPTRNGGRTLGAVEWFAPDADQDLATDSDRPSLAGIAFNGPMEGHEPGMPVHYDLHAWLFTHNPDGRFASFNPRVHC